MDTPRRVPGRLAGDQAGAGVRPTPLRVRVKGWAGVRLAALAALCGVQLSGCELQEVTSTQGAGFVVAEVVLEAGADSQYAYLHRAVGQGSVRVTDAQVTVSDQAGQQLAFAPVGYWRCLSPEPGSPAAAGSCYGADSRGFRVAPGGTYQLHVRTAEGEQLAGTTTVPAAVRLQQPGTTPCALAPDTVLELRWGAAEGAWVYTIEARFTDIFPVLVQRGVVADTPNVPLRLQGFSIGAGDTTLVLPSELGLFDRFDATLHPILLALSGGLPEGVGVDLVIAAADRNYVNWVRGGSFNPSGAVRVPSVRGAGTGVFGSFSSARLSMRVGPGGALPRCR